MKGGRVSQKVYVNRYISSRSDTSDEDDILDEDQQEELHEYFIDSESEDILVALDEFEGDYDEEELRIYRIKFLNDVSN